jgi:acylphosphatase
MACRRFLVTGRVQGVWFRSSTRQQALRLGLTGRADNLADGRVEVVACGDAAALEALERWLWQGPEQAEVSAVEVRAVPDETYDGFATGRKPGSY